MKKIVFGIGLVLSGVALFAFCENEAWASSNDVPIAVNGNLSGINGVIENGHTLLPLRDVTTALGGQVGWNPDDRSVTLYKEDKQITIQIDSYTGRINDHEVRLDVTPEIINDRTYVPLRFLSESLGYPITYRANPSLVNITQVSQNHVTVQTVKLQKEDNNFRVNIQYPQLSGLDNPSIEQQINTLLKGNFTTADHVFTDEDVKNVLMDKQDRPNIKYESDRNYQIRYNQNDIISIVFDDYLYLGGAHGNESQEALTFNLKTGKVYQLADLFAPGTDYQTLVSNDIKQTIISGLPYRFDSSFHSIKADTPNFYVDYDGKLVIYFDKYEYTAGAVGIPEFHINLPIVLQ